MRRLPRNGNYYLRRTERARRELQAARQAEADAQMARLDGLLAGVDIEALIAPLVDRINADREGP